MAAAWILNTLNIRPQQRQQTGSDGLLPESILTFGGIIFSIFNTTRSNEKYNHIPKNMFQEYVPRELWLRKACALPRNFPEYISWNTFPIVYFPEYIPKIILTENLYPCIDRETGD